MQHMKTTSEVVAEIMEERDADIAKLQAELDTVRKCNKLYNDTIDRMIKDEHEHAEQISALKERHAQRLESQIKVNQQQAEEIAAIREHMDKATIGLWETIESERKMQDEKYYDLRDYKDKQIRVQAEQIAALETIKNSFQGLIDRNAREALAMRQLLTKKDEVVSEQAEQIRELQEIGTGLGKNLKEALAENQRLKELVTKLSHGRMPPSINHIASKFSG